MKRFLLAAVAATMLLSASAGHAAREETAPYSSGLLGDNFLFCDGIVVDPVGQVAPGNHGGACFDVVPGETSFIATITDDLMPAVGLSVALYDAAGTQLGDFVPGCVEARGAIPAGTAYLGVFADGVIFGTLDCGLPLPATSGSITVQFDTPS